MTKIKVVQKFPRTLNEDDFGLTADVTGSSTKFVKIAQYTILAQTIMTFGNGSIQNGVDNRGLLYIKMIDTADGTSELTGWDRLVLADANEINSIVVLEERSARLSATQTDRTTGYFLGEYPIAKGQDSFLQVWFKCDTASKSIDTNSVFQIPTTVGILEG